MPKGGRPPRRGWEDKFFDAWRETGMVHNACQKAGVSKSYVYRHRKQDPEFAQRWQEEEERVTELLEQIAVRRAGESSDTLLIFLLKARRPDTYRENIKHDHSHVVQGHIELEVLDGRDPIEFEAKKRREAARMLLTRDGEDVIEAEARPALPAASAA